MTKLRILTILFIIFGIALFYVYPQLAYKYEAIPFNTLTDNYNRWQGGDYYHDYIKENQKKFKPVIDAYYQKHKRFPANIEQLYQDATRKGYWVKLQNPFLRTSGDNHEDFIVDYICCELDQKYEGRLLYDSSKANQYILYAAHEHGSLVKVKGVPDGVTGEILD